MTSAYKPGSYIFNLVLNQPADSICQPVKALDAYKILSIDEFC